MTLFSISHLRSNLHGLTIRGHVLPVASLRRFADPGGFVSVLRHEWQSPKPLKPTNRMFCANRAWNHRSERVLKNSIEDPFQAIANQIAAGRRRLDPAQHILVSNFYALWRVRAQRKAFPLRDQPLRGVTPNEMPADQRDLLEKHGIIVVDPPGVIRGRDLAGIVIQREIDEITDQLQHQRWGIAVASDGEFVVPDEFGSTLAVPVTPTLYLVAASPDTVLPRNDAKQLNQAAKASARAYLVARDFSQCPL